MGLLPIGCWLWFERSQDVSIAYRQQPKAIYVLCAAALNLALIAETSSSFDFAF